MILSLFIGNVDHRFDIPFSITNENSVRRRKNTLIFVREHFSLGPFPCIYVEVSFQMTTVGTGVTKSAALTPALIISSDGPAADVSRAIGPVTVTMTVGTSVMRPKSIVPKVSNFVKLRIHILNCYGIFGVFQSDYYIKIHCLSEKKIRETV